MTQQLTKQRRDVRDLIQSDSTKAQLALVLPKYLTPDRMARVACSTVMRVPKLGQCEPASLLQAIMLCAQAGLEPDGRYAHLIPYGREVQVIFDYKGLVHLARKNGVQNIASEVVCERDTFEWWRNGEGLQFEHRVDWRQPRGDVQAAYCIWRDGDQFDGEVMTRTEIEGIQQRSAARNSGPWKTDWNEMAKKTVIRRASKRWPLASEMALAIQNEDGPTVNVAAAPQRPNFLAAPPEPEPEETPETANAADPDAVPFDGDNQPPAPAKPKAKPANGGDKLAKLSAQMDEVGMSFDMLLKRNEELDNLVPMLSDHGGLDELSKGQISCILAVWDKLTGEGGAE